jgi:hypothetical protein
MFNGVPEAQGARCVIQSVLFFLGHNLVWVVLSVLLVFKFSYVVFFFFYQPEAEMIEEDATVVVYTSGLQLSAAQAARMNQCVSERGLGMGSVLVHKLSTSDINLTGLV